MSAVLPQRGLALVLTTSMVGLAASLLTTTPFGLLAPVAGQFLLARGRAIALLNMTLAIALAGSVLAAISYADGTRDFGLLWAAFFALALCIGAIVAASVSASTASDFISRFTDLTGSPLDEEIAPELPQTLARDAAIDMDVHEKTVAALRDREQELSQLVDMVPSHLWRLTPDGEATFFNKRMADFLGLDVANTDKSGMRRLEVVVEMVHPEDAAEFRDALNRCLVTGERFSMRYRLRRADGAYRWMSSCAEPMRDHAGRIVQWYGLSHDIDDQMHAEEALRDRERELSLLVDMVPSHLWRVTPEGETTFLTKHMADFLGVDASHTFELDAVMATIFHPDDTAEVNDVFGRCLATGECFSMKYRLRCQDGAYRWMSGRAEPLRDDGGRIVQWFGLCHVGTGFRETERIFEPFFTTKQHGMGMGPTICRSIIESHGGRFWTANNETRGATVAFTLPLAASEAP
ncbi:MAG: hypothetical protein K0R27_3833 [Xanthobacteraceae bacterium]|nr:hypothetical protein [Xanthobacteraceae bacterium]